MRSTRSGRSRKWRLNWLLIAVVPLVACDRDDNGAVGPPRELREVYHQYPAWSPDGEMIAFWRQPEHVGESPVGVWLYHVQDSTLSFVIGGDTPRWSPDGTELAISLDAQIAVVSVSSGVSRPLTNFGRNWFPSYSPDGRWIVFNRTSPFDSSGLWIIDAEGVTRPELIPGTEGREASGAAFQAAWSPNGEWIAFSVEEFGSRGEFLGVSICIIRPDGSGLEQLTERRWSTRGVAWSPDGGRIAYSTVVGQRHGIHILDLATRQDRRLVSTEVERLASSQGVSWSPDGRFLVYNREYLWIVEPDDSNNRQLTGPDGCDGLLTPY